MARLKSILVLAAATAGLAFAGQAYAQTAPRAPQPRAQAAANARDAYTLNESQSAQVIELDGSRRWGLKLEIQQPVTRQTELRDVEAGAFYKLTPSIRLGGALGVVDTTAPTAERPTPPQTTPRVRLGAAFKF